MMDRRRSRSLSHYLMELVVPSSTFRLFSLVTCSLRPSSLSRARTLIGRLQEWCEARHLMTVPLAWLLEQQGETNSDGSHALPRWFEIQGVVCLLYTSP